MADADHASRGARASVMLEARPLPRSARLADRLYEQILEQIVSGNLEKGSRLPRRRSFAGSSMSRGPSFGKLSPGSRRTDWSVHGRARARTFSSARRRNS